MPVTAAAPSRQGERDIFNAQPTTVLTMHQVSKPFLLVYTVFSPILHHHHQTRLSMTDTYPRCRLQRNRPRRRPSFSRLGYSRGICTIRFPRCVLLLLLSLATNDDICREILRSYWARFLCTRRTHLRRPTPFLSCPRTTPTLIILS